ncbi:PHP domain-containing protein [Acidithiobacillus sp. AMEEHan]|uniref:PHP domain-containing protein n=1 Tax=Acidithiobacillus sp. AMEEHan TaxID=2994951 RepID=UPI0027E51678|nr:PHP domain-containing protein [Acidithiobacillus sp. AMEEHan]
MSQSTPPRSAVDLHMHSLHSDGSMLVEDLVARVVERGVRLMALTDHDNTAGITTAATEAERLGIDFIPGVEISSEWSGIGIHIVGLGIDIQNPELQMGLERIMEFRDWRAAEISRLLDNAGIPGAEAGARKLAGSRMVGRTHFARWLKDSGYCRDNGEAFQRWLGRGQMAYVPSDWIPMRDAISWIRLAGGVAVVAHPGRYKLSAERLRELFVEFRDAGGGAIEVSSGSQAAADREHLAKLARQLNLAASLGSDFHGPEIGHAELGQLAPLPVGVQPVWECLGHSFPLSPVH